MKKIFHFFLLAIFFASSANASELLGTISTNPNQNSSTGQNNPSSSGSPAKIAPLAPTATSSQELPKKIIVVPGLIIQPAAPEKENVKNILGIKAYPDGTLLRGADHRIYLISGQAKKYIADQRELGKYRGRPILNASAEELAYYNQRAHLDGELVRQKGEVKVYVIIKGAKKHILNLEELRAHYAGLEIFNIEPEEMALY